MTGMGGGKFGGCERHADVHWDDGRNVCTIRDSEGF